MEERERITWMTRVVAILCITALGMMAMYMEIDGIWVPLFAAAGISGIAGYELQRLLSRVPGSGRG